MFLRLAQPLPEGGALHIRDQRVRVDVVHRHRLPDERRRVRGKGLRRPALFAGHLALRHGTLLDRPHRRAGHAIEDVEETGLAGHRHDVDLLAVPLDLGQLGCGVVVEIPQVVVDVLEVPQALAGPRVEGEETVGEQVGTDAVGSVIVVGGRPGREIGDAAFGVNRDLAPGIRAADVLIGVLGPRLVAGFAGMRDGVKLPYELAGQDVVRAQVSGRRQ